MRPRILLTRGRAHPAQYAAYVERLTEAGADVRPVVDPDDVPAEFDGVCLAGGPDVAPGRYGQPPAPDLGVVDADRDHLELDVLLPRSRGKPVLAICRGIQVLNVHRRGTLVQHIGEAHHATGDDVILRAARIEPTSRLAGISGAGAVVNHRHHQVVDRLGDGLRAVAWSDGYVEGLEATDEPWVVGVQWHPERVCDGLDPSVTAIFGAFVRSTQGVTSR